MKVREAKRSDIPGIVECLKVFHAESGYAGIDVSEDHATEAIGVCINDRFSFCLVVDDDKTIEGVLMGHALPIWWARPSVREAADLVFYTSEKAKGMGHKMMIKYMAWARREKSVKRVMLGVTSGLNDTRTNKFYERMGGVWQGGYYVIDVTEQAQAA